jgi:sialate O-acetylesterase
MANEIGGIFHPAAATITAKDAVALSSPDVEEPTAARHAWANWTTPNLVNSEGLPAEAFSQTSDKPSD